MSILTVEIRLIRLYNSPMTQDLMTTQEVAQLLGVGPTAVKRWADEGLLPCIKTAGGHRRILRADAEKFMRGGLASQAPAEVSPLPAENPEMERWLEILVSEDLSYALEGLLLTERARRGSWAAVADHVGQVMEQVGLCWSRGEWTVLQEHLASERLVRSLLKAGETLELPYRAPKALLVAPDGEDHTLGLSLLEIVVRECGWKTVWAGRRTPVEELTAMILEGKVDLVASSATAYLNDPQSLSDWVEKVGGACQKARIQLVVGGRAAWPEPPPYGHRVKSFSQLNELLRSWKA